jgi:hypothetical protein
MTQNPALNSWFEGLQENVIRLQVDSIYGNNEDFPGTYQSFFLSFFFYN